jgi:high-affinity Fe2+/Pb2+ permease
MHSHLFAKSVRCTAIIICASIFLVGCTAQDLQQLQQARTQAVATLDQAQTAQSQIQKQLTTLPASDPLRQQLEPKLEKLDALITQIQTYVPVLDGAIRSLGTGQPDPALQQAAAVIPYGSLALALIGVVFGVIKHVQAGNLSDQEAQTQKAFEQIVSALDAALPTPTPEQKAAVDAVLDTDVKAKVAAVRL